MAGLIVSGPLMLILCFLIRINSEGAAIFRQERVGMNRRVFVCFKLRTMAKDTMQAGTHEVSFTSVTAFGKFLRSSKLDEIPQLWNVVRGDMSFVGPRPCLPSQDELIEERNRLGVYAVLPGATGLSQVRGIDMSDPKRLAKSDAEYVNSKSFGRDIKIVLQTLTGKGQGDRVKGS